MAAPRPGEPAPVKLIAAVIWADSVALETSKVRMTDAWGSIDYEGADHDFDVTDYYESEMGSGLRRRIVAFESLVGADALPDLKILSNAIEVELAVVGRRAVNLDIGYLDDHKVVLASVKAAGQKIYLGRGVWADMMLRYRGGHLVPLEWTFPDFQDGRYESDLLAIRQRYMRQRRAWSSIF